MLPVVHAALAFTPAVSLQPPAGAGAAADTVLLEVESSLRYFGGLPRLLERLEAAVEPLGHAVRIGTAVTAQGAALLSRLEAPPRCTDLVSTRQALDRLPVWLLGPGREHWEALQGMGLRTLSDLVAMPRSGLARRFSEELLSEIDAALGRRPDPRQPIAPPPSFESRLELFARADTSEQVLHGASVLLERMIAWLAAKHAFVRRFRLLMLHEPRWRQNDRTPPVSVLDIALAEPSRDSGHLLMLLSERLARAQLPAPTLELAVQADDISRQPPPNQELFPTRQSAGEGLTRLVERLQARLGSEQVQCLAARDDHRPERRSAVRTADAARLAPPTRVVSRSRGHAAAPARSRSSSSSSSSPASPSPSPSRSPSGSPSRSPSRSPSPVWLQAEPQPLREAAAQPLLDGRPLRLLSGPERVETGWWDGGLAERDYFIAAESDGALVWIYRTRLLPADPSGSDQSGWFLHGRFG